MARPSRAHDFLMMALEQMREEAVRRRQQREPQSAEPSLGVQAGPSRTKARRTRKRPVNRC